MIPVYVVLALFVFVGLLVALSFNRLVRLRNKVVEAWQDVDVQLQRRHDLIPRLVEIIEGYTVHEKGLLNELARLRADAERASGAAAKSVPESELAVAFGRTIAVVEAYPSLRAAENFLSLQKEIAETEDEVAAARIIYNGNVRIYNTHIQTFPVSFYADLLGFEPEYFFQADEGDRTPVSVPV